MVIGAGEGVTFNVTATGEGLAYQWQHNGTAIPDATEASYTIASASAADNGTYTVTVSNAAGVAATEKVTLPMTPADATRSFAAISRR